MLSFVRTGKHLRRAVCASFIAGVSIPAIANQEEPEIGVVRSDMPGEIAVCFRSDDSPANLGAIIDEWRLPQVDVAWRHQASKLLLSWRRPREDRVTNVVLLRFPPQTHCEPLLRHLAQLEGVLWAAPNAQCTGNVKDLIPNDPRYVLQYHHPLMQNEAAWDVTSGDPSVIVAIVDDGIEIHHQDLAAGIWVNPNEAALDGIDNDGNGYVDDVKGWDFAAGNNNPNPNSGFDFHGTHVAGIVGARTNNGVGLAGTAGGVTIMPVQFYAYGYPWTAANYAESFAYAVGNGARIVSTSFYLDGWVNDPIVIAAFTYLYDHGGLHFNSAGNGDQLNPIRQAFHQTLLVASTDANDVRSSYSNYGSGIDVAAPGSSIQSTLLNNKYGSLSGTSMAAPNAAAVAALIWSAHPTWTRDQVAAQLIDTADDITAQNPALAGLLGGGRVNAHRGVTETPKRPAPRVVQSTLPGEGAATVELNAFRIAFDQVMQTEAVNTLKAFSLLSAGPGGVFGDGDDQLIAMSWEYFIGGNGVLEFTLPGALPTGRYRFIADATTLHTPFGVALDGEGDGIEGGDWQVTFRLSPDCNANGLPDDDEILANLTLDCNENGVPDECECMADLNGDEVVNVIDLLALLGDWGVAGSPLDLDGDGTVDLPDLIALLCAWGPCL